MTDRYIEYFVCCNPPLLPNGVRQVIDAARQQLKHLFDEDFVEIVYEPEVAWFKCTSFSTNQDEIIDVLEDLLYQVVFSEMEVKDVKHGNNAKSEADVEVVALEPRIMPWAAYCQRPVDFNDSSLYPGELAEYLHKAVWRGLDALPEYNVEDLLRVAALLWNDDTTCRGGQDPLDLPTFGKIMKCDALPNLGQTVVYLGSGGAKYIERAMRGLDNMASAMNLLSNPEHSQHYIITEDHGLGKLAYRYLSHHGLDKLTLIPPNDLSAAMEYDVILNHAATLRIVEEDHEGSMTPDHTIYAGAMYAKPDISKPLATFEDYSFKAKTPILHKKLESEVQIIPTKPDTKAPQAAQAADASRSRSDSTQKVSEWVEKLPASGDLISFGEDAMRSPVSGDDQASPSMAQTPYTATDSTLASTPALTMPASIQHQPAVTQPAKPSGNLLDSFLQEDADPIHEMVTDSHLDLVGPESLILKWDPLEPERPSSSAPRRPEQQTGPLESGIAHSKFGNPSAPYRDDDAEDLLLDSPVLFSIQEDSPKDMHTTMNQKAGRKPKSKAGENGSQKKGPGVDHSNQGVTKATEAGTAETSVTETASAPGRAKTHRFPRINLALPANRKQGGRPQHKSGLLKKLESEAEKVAKNLQWATGKVTLELKFGRLYFRKLRESHINIGSGPHWDTAELLRTLRDESTNPGWEGRTGFQSILSSSGEDGDALIKTEIEGQFPWNMEPVEKTVFFHFACSIEGPKIPKAPFVIKVNADAPTEYSCESPAEEISSISIHCPRRAWDMKLTAERFRMNGLPPECYSFAKALSESLKISVLSSGEIALEGLRASSGGVSVERIEIKYNAKYEAQNPGCSLLNITMTRPIKKGANAGEDTSIFRGISNFAAIKRRSPKGGPHQWIEASISSSAAEKLFAENVGMKFAERTSWRPETLKAAGTFEDICRPGLAMIVHMDGIGAANDNGKGPKGQASNDGSQRPQGHGPPAKYEYW